MTTTRNPVAPTWPRQLTAAVLAKMPAFLPDGVLVDLLGYPKPIRAK